MLCIDTDMHVHLYIFGQTNTFFSPLEASVLSVQGYVHIHVNGVGLYQIIDALAIIFPYIVTAIS